MKTKVSPSVIGAFALGALVLAVIALISFGSIDFLHKRQRFLVYFDESTHGLNVGSPIQLSGVAVGRVVDMHVRYDSSTNHSAVAVLCEFDRNMISDTSGRVIDVTKPAEIQSLVDHGLRAQLGIIGLATGLAYIELTFEDPRVYPAGPPVPGAEEAVVPAIPSTISELYSNATEIMSKLKRIDYAKLAEHFQALLDTARSQIDGIDLKGAVAEWKAAGVSVNTLANLPEILQALRTFNATLVDARATLNRLNTQVDRNGQDLQTTLAQAGATLKQFNDAALTLRRFIEAQGDLGAGATQALRQISDAADSVQRLADFLERNPNALIVGKKAKP